MCFVFPGLARQAAFPSSVAASIGSLALAATIWLEATAAFAGNMPVLQSRPHLGPADHLATLHAIDTALSSVADGGAFVWERRNGSLRGLIRPTASFKSSSGEICRHVIIRLDSGLISREVEGIACRAPTGVWSLSG